MFPKQQNMKWSETELCIINGETYLLWMLLKKVTWYKYANINKAIRKPPIMTNMLCWKEKKRKNAFCTFANGIRMWKRSLLPAVEQKSSRRLILHLSSVLKSKTLSFSPKNWEVGVWGMKRAPALPISHRWRLPFKNLHRRCTGLSPTMKGILSLSIISHAQSTVNTHTHTPTQLKEVEPTLPWTHKNKLDLNDLYLQLTGGWGGSWGGGGGGQNPEQCFCRPDETNVGSNNRDTNTEPIFTRLTVQC